MPNATEVTREWMAATAENWQALTDHVRDGDQFVIVAVIIAGDAMDIAVTQQPGASAEDAIAIGRDVLSSALENLMFGDPEYVVDRPL